jgi:hypothetical protein
VREYNHNLLPPLSLSRQPTVRVPRPHTGTVPQKTLPGFLTYDGVPLYIWRGRRLCVQRTGQPAVNFAKHTIRPKPVSGTCPSGYRKCGTGTYDDNHAICFPSSLQCPINNLEVGPHC